jgi:hypothetical protein
MSRHSDAHLAGRQRARLRLARENGYLNARCAAHQLLVQAFSLWCWRLRIPMVWLEYRTPRSRYGRVHLDMFTTSNRLTAAGQAEMVALGQARASPHDACWERVPLRDLERLASSVLRAAVRPGNYEPNRLKLVADVRRQNPEKLFAVA